MAKHLTKDDVEKILSILDGWDEKLTWDALCKECKGTIGTTPTRQTLSAHKRIAEAFKQRKVDLKAGLRPSRRPQSLDIAQQRIMRLEAEVARLKGENQRLLERFVVWQYNAYKRGMSDDMLNMPLPPIDRESKRKG